MKSLWVRTFWLLLAMLCMVFVPVKLILGTTWGLLALIGGILTLFGWHLYHFGQLLNWQEGPLDSALPRGRGLWEIAFAGLHRRVRIRLGQQQSLATTLERFVRAFRMASLPSIATSTSNGSMSAPRHISPCRPMPTADRR